MAAAAEGTFISIYENAAGNVIGTYTNEKYSSMGSCMGFSPDGNYFAASQTCFHQDGTVRFEIDGMMAISSPIQFMGENIVYPDGSSICIVSGKDGSLVREIHYNANVCNFAVMEEDGAILVGLSDGTVLASIIKEKDVLNWQYMEAGDDRMRHIYHYLNKIIEEPVNSNKILIYQNALGEQAQKLVRVNATEYDAGILNQGCVSEDGNILVGIASDKSSFSYNVETKEQTDLKWKGDILISNMQGTKYLVADEEADQVSIYSFGETVPEASIEVKENFINAAGFSPDGKRFIVLQEQLFFLFQYMTLRCLWMRQKRF